jgi:predicted DNA-binding protein (MmcQ/YjbR family)
MSLGEVKKTDLKNKELKVYSVGDVNFAYFEANKVPLRISLRCDPKLSKLLKLKYEEVMPAHQLNPKQWISIVISGQLSTDELEDLIRHSYILATESV